MFCSFPLHISIEWLVEICRRPTRGRAAGFKPPEAFQAYDPCSQTACCRWEAHPQLTKITPRQLSFLSDLSFSHRLARLESARCFFRTTLAKTISGCERRVSKRLGLTIQVGHELVDVSSAAIGREPPLRRPLTSTSPHRLAAASCLPEHRISVGKTTLEPITNHSDTTLLRLLFFKIFVK